jgi:predicted DCC family thiol-disulfide oxidoreductase YuxK
MSSAIVIYDGECGFCKESVTWIERRVSVTSHPFQSDVARGLGVDIERCKREVVVLHKDVIYGGADAVIHLLKLANKRGLARLLTVIRPLTVRGYQWVALHRRSPLVRLIHLLLKIINRQSK